MSPNLFRNLFLALLGVKVMVRVVLNLLNLVHLRRNAGKVPLLLNGLIDGDQLRAIDSYTADKIRFRLVGFIFDTLLLALFLFTPLFAAYSGWIDSLPWPGFWKGLLFFLLPGWAAWLADLPFDYYFHFVIEFRFGFNKYTRGGWLLDAVKNLSVTTALTVVVLTVVLAIWGGRTHFGLYDVLAGWAMIMAMTLILMYLVPVLLIPLFYKLRPLPDGELKEAITALVSGSGFAVRGVFIADQSSKSAHANAQFAGFGKSKTIILFDTLVQNYSISEILAVLAHEIGHGKQRHLVRMISFVLAESLLFLIFAFHLLEADYTFAAFGVRPSFYAGLFVTYILFFDILVFYAQPLFSRLSRKMEYEADDYSRRLIGAIAPLVSVFKKFIVNEMDNINPHPWYEAFYYSHPALLKRIKALERKQSEQSS
jgi:STE24 endopeptidase